MKSAEIESIWTKVSRGLSVPADQGYHVLVDNVRLREQIKAFCAHQMRLVQRREQRQDLERFLLVLEGHPYRQSERNSPQDRTKRFFHQEDTDG